MKLLFLGPPNSGKGTFSRMISEKYDLPTFSMGEMFREWAETDKEGKKIKEEYMDKGKLVPHEIVMKLARGIVHNKKDFILDGFPRDVWQAKELDKITKLDLVIYLEVTKKTIIERVKGRLQCETCGRVYHIKNIPPPKSGKCECGGKLIRRDDDKDIKVLEERLRAYDTSTKPLIDYYKKEKILVEIDGNRKPEIIEKEIESIIEKKKRNIK